MSNNFTYFGDNGQWTISKRGHLMVQVTNDRKNQVLKDIGRINSIHFTKQAKMGNEFHASVWMEVEGKNGKVHLKEEQLRYIPRASMDQIQFLLADESFIGKRLTGKCSLKFPQKFSQKSFGR